MTNVQTRIERRIVLGHLTDEYRVAERRKATVEDIRAGRSTGRYIWVGITEWSEEESEEAAMRGFTCRRD